MKIFSEFIAEANRKAQRASKSGRTPKEGSRSKGDYKPKGVVTVGLPGSGKSTIAKHMVSKGNTDQHELDKSRQALGKGPAHFGQDIVHHTYSGAKKSAEQGRSTVLSNTSIPKQHRQDAIDKLKDAGYENVKAVLSPGSTKAAMRRNRKRTGSKPGEGAVPQFVMNRMAQGMKSMSRAERRKLRGNYKELHKSERFTKPAMKRSGAIREAKEAKPPKEVLNKISRAYAKKHRGVNVSVTHHSDTNSIRVNQLWVPPDLQGRGIGTRVMKGLGKYADKTGSKITLTQDPDKGKKGKLAKFYKSHGFESNRGRKRDFSTRDTHIRHPRG